MPEITYRLPQEIKLTSNYPQGAESAKLAERRAAAVPAGVSSTAPFTQ